MDIKDIVIDVQQTLGSDPLTVNAVYPKFAYDDKGSKTAEVVGYYYLCVCPSRGCRVRIAVKGARQLTPDQVERHPKVELVDPVIRIYQMQGEHRLSITAAEIRPIKEPAT